MLFYLLLIASVNIFHFEILCCEQYNERIYPNLSIAAFNIQNFGVKKFYKEDVVNIIKKIITRYDLICLQEVIIQRKNFLQNLLKDINKFSSSKPFGMILSVAVGRNITSKENYVYFYRTDRLQPSDVRIYSDPKKQFIRPPYIAHFKSPTTKSVSSFIAICVHIKPTNVAKEVNALAEVYDYAENFYHNKNAVIMGDFNAACKNLRISDWHNIALWNRSEFVWLVNNSIDTTTYASSCAYDRIIITGKELKQDAIYNSARALDFQAEYNITEKMAREISDHYPVEFYLRGKVSAVFTKNLIVNLCLNTYDKRPYNLSIFCCYTFKNNKILDFDIATYYDAEGMKAKVTATKKSTNLQDILNSLENFNRELNVLSFEVIETIRFKAEHSSLVDFGSYNTIKAKYTLYIECNLVNCVCTVYLCKETYFN